MAWQNTWVIPGAWGLERSGLINITENEIYAFRRQLLMAEERKMPVVIHLPHLNKAKGAKIIVDIIKAEGVTQRWIEIDHNTEDTMSITRDTDCFTGMTVYPYSKLNPERVALILKEYGIERMIIDGSVDWGGIRSIVVTQNYRISPSKRIPRRCPGTTIS